MRARAAYDLDRALADGTAAPSTVAVLSTLAQVRAGLEQQTALRPEFRDELRRRLVAVAAVRPVDAPPAPAAGRPPARRRVALALAAAGCAVAVGGLALASERALPGEPLYTAKRVTEGLQMRTASSPVERGLRHLEQAETRLAEVRALAAGADVGLASASGWTAAAAAGSDDEIDATLEEMDEQTRLGGEGLREAARASGDAQVLLTLRAWTDEQAVDLREVAALLPTRVRERAETSLSVVAVVRRDADAVLAEVCDPAGSAAAPPACTSAGAGPAGLPPATPLPSAPPAPTSAAPDRPGHADPERPQGVAPPVPGAGGPAHPGPAGDAPADAPADDLPDEPGPADPSPAPSGPVLPVPTPTLPQPVEPTPSQTRDPLPGPTGTQDPDTTAEPTPTPIATPTDDVTEEPDGLGDGPGASASPTTPPPAPADPPADPSPDPSDGDRPGPSAGAG